MSALGPATCFGLAARHMDVVDLANRDEEGRVSERTRVLKAGKYKTLCVIDLDATTAARSAGR
ncbi:MAG: hypothetical protein ACOH2H_25445 [Cypionkella sp.]